MRHTKLSELTKRKGKLISPWVEHLGDKLSLTSWSLERLPEYIWMALILRDKGRTEGISCCIRIFNKIRAIDSSFSTAKLSNFLEKKDNDQDSLFDIITSEIEPRVLAPLTAIVSHEYSPSFYKHFYTPGFDLEKRVEILSNVTRQFCDPDSWDTTDLRFLALVPMVLSGHVYFAQESPLPDAILYYGNTSHDNEIMKAYRPCIRSIEGVIDLSHQHNHEWARKYWNVTAQVTDCKLYSIKYGKDEVIMDYNLFIEKTKEALNFLNIENKQATVSDDAYSVLTGSFTYAFKTFAEVIEHDLANTLMGRQAIRQIIETLIMMKYLISQACKKPSIWKEYKAYGIGKYKLILMKE